MISGRNGNIGMDGDVRPPRRVAPFSKGSSAKWQAVQRPRRSQLPAPASLPIGSWVFSPAETLPEEAGWDEFPYSEGLAELLLFHSPTLSFAWGFYLLSWVSQSDRSLYPAPFGGRIKMGSLKSKKGGEKNDEKDFLPG